MSILNLKTSIKVKIDADLFIFFTEKKLILRTPKVLRKVLLKLFRENYAIKISYSVTLKALVWKQVCWVQNSKCASCGMLTLYILFVKYYRYVEYKDWPQKRVRKKSMPFSISQSIVYIYSDFKTRNKFTTLQKVSKLHSKKYLLKKEL